MHNSQWIVLPTQSCLVLYSFFANLLHSLILWLMVSSLSPHSLHFLFCCVLSILALIWLVLMTLFCAAIRGDTVSLLKFPFLSQVQGLLCEMFISRLKRPYLKPYNCIIIRNNTTAYKSFALDKNTWYQMTVHKLFVLNKNTWTYIKVCRKLSRNNFTKCLNTNIQ